MKDFHQRRHVPLDVEDRPIIAIVVHESNDRCESRSSLPRKAAQRRSSEPCAINDNASDNLRAWTGLLQLGPPWDDNDDDRRCSSTVRGEGGRKPLSPEVRLCLGRGAGVVLCKAPPPLEVLLATFLLSIQQQLSKHATGDVPALPMCHHACALHQELSHRPVWHRNEPSPLLLAPLMLDNDGVAKCRHFCCSRCSWVTTW